jgi:hypothetical protein
MDRASAPEGLLSARTVTVVGELLKRDMSQLDMLGSEPEHPASAVLSAKTASNLSIWSVPIREASKTAKT